LALAIFIVFSSPVGSHAIAAAIHRGTLARNRETMLDSDVFTVLGKQGSEKEETEALDGMTLHPQFQPTNSVWKRRFAA
jgi:hypothetical protein